jgi:hypothetical protein
MFLNNFLLIALFIRIVSGTSELPRCERREAPFGYVQVFRADMQAAVLEGMASKSKAKLEFGLKNVRFGIIGTKCGNLNWGDSDEKNILVYKWPFRAESLPDLTTPELGILRHEIAHDLFVRFLVPSTRIRQYGGDAPDWLDEMAAVSFESPASRSLRRCELSIYARSTGLISFKRFFSMAHPEYVAENSFSLTDNVTEASSSSIETPVFYAMVSGFLDYLGARLKGRRVIPALASAFKRREPLGEFIVNQLKLKNEGGNFRELDADFKSWMASDRRIQKAAKCFGQK